MSRSYRKTPIVGITIAPSDKDDKRRANRKYRHRVRQTLVTDPMCDVIPDRRQVTDVWDMAKDGKKYFDTQKQPTLLRK